MVLYGHKWGFPKIRGTFLRIPIIRTTVYWGLYLGTLVSGNHQIYRNFPGEIRQGLLALILPRGTQKCGP